MTMPSSTAPQAQSNRPQKTQKVAEAGRRPFSAFLRFLRFQYSGGSAAFRLQET
jgi:hypothetical protein